MRPNTSTICINTIPKWPWIHSPLSIPTTAKLSCIFHLAYCRTLVSVTQTWSAQLLSHDEALPSPCSLSPPPPTPAFLALTVLCTHLHQYETCTQYDHYIKHVCLLHSRTQFSGFPGGSVVNSLPARAGNMGSTPGPGRSHMPWSNQARVPQHVL